MAIRAFQIIPKKWRGIRNSEAALLLDPDEWSDSKNFDARMGWSSAGSTLVQTTPVANKALLGLTHYFDKTGVLHPVIINEDGTIFDDNVAIGPKFSTAAISLTDPAGAIPDFAPGVGGIVIARGTSLAPLRKDPADDVWKELVGATPKFTGVSIERAGPRLFGFPNSSTESDTMAWSAAADFTKWLTADGGGAEPVGSDREPITGIEGGLEDAMAVYKRNHIYVRNGTDPETWKITLVASDIGLTAPATLIRIGKSHFFVHESGPYFLNAVGAVIFPHLAERVQKTWDDMVANFGSWLRFAHAAYHPRENTIYCWLPNQASRLMNRLMKIYVPTLSVTLHDGKTAGYSAFEPAAAGRLLYGGSASKTFETKGLTDDGTAITSDLTPGIFAGSPPTPDMEKKWGFRGVVHVYLEAEGAVPITLTPRVYRDDAQVVGSPQNFTLVANRVTKVKMKMPTQMGWGFDFVLSAITSLGRWRLLGYSGIYEDITDA